MRLCPSLMVCCLLFASLAGADEVSHRASAERFLKLANAEGMTAPVYTQVEQLLTARFTRWVARCNTNRCCAVISSKRGNCSMRN